ncbi:hypothetical protein Bbelb_019300 [Branchiostoma belcheri]|nr:hypothetical protein Bbelb_019300 [Branchiostoma belcheri]
MEEGRRHPTLSGIGTVLRMDNPSVRPHGTRDFEETVTASSSSFRTTCPNAAASMRTVINMESCQSGSTKAAESQANGAGRKPTTKDGMLTYAATTCGAKLEIKTLINNVKQDSGQDQSIRRRLDSRTPPEGLDLRTPLEGLDLRTPLEGLDLRPTPGVNRKETDVVGTDHYRANSLTPPQLLWSVAGHPGTVVLHCLSQLRAESLAHQRLRQSSTICPDGTCSPCTPSGSSL